MFLQGNLPGIAASLHKKVSDTGVIGKEDFNEKNFQKSLIWFICAVFVCLSGAQTVRAAEISEQSDLAQQLAYQAALTMYYDDRYSIQNDYPDYVIERISGQIVTSRQVQNGQVSYFRDNNVLVKTSDTTLTAAGTGTATVVLKKGSGRNAAV